MQGSFHSLAANTPIPRMPLDPLDCWSSGFAREGLVIENTPGDNLSFLELLFPSAKCFTRQGSSAPCKFHDARACPACSHRTQDYSVELRVGTMRRLTSVREHFSSSLVLGLRHSATISFRGALCRVAPSSSPESRTYVSRCALGACPNCSCDDVSMQRRPHGHVKTRGKR